MKDLYCRFIKFLFLRSHSLVVVVRRNGKVFGPQSMEATPTTFNDGIEVIEIAMIPNYRATGSFVRIR